MPAINPIVIAIDIIISLTEISPLTPEDWNIANNDIIIISSMIAVPRINVADSSFIMLSSPNTLMTITVLVTDIARAINKLS